MSNTRRLELTGAHTTMPNEPQDTPAQDDAHQQAHDAVDAFIARRNAAAAAKPNPLAQPQMTRLPWRTQGNEQ